MKFKQILIFLTWLTTKLEILDCAALPIESGFKPMENDVFDDFVSSTSTKTDSKDVIWTLKTTHSSADDHAEGKKDDLLSETLEPSQHEVIREHEHPPGLDLHSSEIIESIANNSKAAISGTVSKFDELHHVKNETGSSVEHEIPPFDLDKENLDLVKRDHGNFPHGSAEFEDQISDADLRPKEVSEVISSMEHDSEVFLKNQTTGVVSPEITSLDIKRTSIVHPDVEDDMDFGLATVEEISTFSHKIPPNETSEHTDQDKIERIDNATTDEIVFSHEESQSKTGHSDDKGLVNATSDDILITSVDEVTLHSRDDHSNVSEVLDAVDWITDLEKSVERSESNNASEVFAFDATGNFNTHDMQSISFTLGDDTLEDRETEAITVPLDITVDDNHGKDAHGSSGECGGIGEGSCLATNEVFPEHEHDHMSYTPTLDHELNSTITESSIKNATNDTSINQEINVQSVANDIQEVLENAGIISSDFNVNETNLNSNLSAVEASEESTSEGSKVPGCPPPGLCIFWFFAQDTCAIDSHCLGSRICCKIRCSKTCIEV